MQEIEEEPQIISVDSKQEFKKILKMGIYNQLNKDGMLTDMQLDLLKDKNKQRFTCI